MAAQHYYFGTIIMSNRKLFISLLIFLLTVLAIFYSYVIHIGQNNYLLKDYGEFYKATQFAIQKENIYTRIIVTPKQDQQKTVLPARTKLAAMLDPPFFVLLILPLGYLTYGVSLWLWSLFSIGCGVLSIILLTKLFNDRSKLLTFGLLIAFFSYLPTFNVMFFGQVTLLLMPLTIGAWLAAHRKYFGLLGLLLGIAAAIKIFFGLFLFYFLMRREWRALFAFILTFLICTALPILPFGFQSYLNYYSILHSINWYSSSWNASILGVLSRLFGGEPNAPLFALPHIVQPLYWLLSGIMLIALLKFLQPAKTIEPAIKLDLDFAVITVAMLLLSPFGWFYYFSLLTVPIIVLFKLAAKHHYWPLYLLTAIAVALCSVTFDLQLPATIIATNAWRVFFEASIYTTALIILLSSLFFCRYQLVKIPIYGNFSFSNTEHIIFFIIILIPSLLNIIGEINSFALYGEQLIPNFTAVQFGS